MEETSVIVIGAGVVGLAIAQRLSRSHDEIIVVEKHESFGRETSSRNSEVIHAGIYHPTGSLKAQLCVPGNRKLYEFCAEHNVPHRKTGKLIVANDEHEVSAIEPLYNLGTQNGVPGLRLLDGKEIAALEPNARALMGMYSPSSGIVDTHSLMAELERQCEARSATIAYGCEVIGISRNGDGFDVALVDVDGESMKLHTRALVNAAGLSADRVAQMAGIDIDASGYRMSYCKGEYFAVAGRHRGKLTHLVYPPPTNVSLGTHAVLLLDGSLKLGPNAFYVDAVEYSVDPGHQSEFYESARKYFPFIEADDLSPDMAGVRPKIQKEHEPFRDFVIREESDRDLPRLVNLIGIESPGLTSALAIAEHVDTLIRSVET